MKTRNTLILFVLAVGIFAFIHFYESKLPTTKEAAEQANNVVKIDREKINAITLTNNEDKVVLHKADGKWQLDAPVKDRADETAITALLTGVETLRKETSLDGGDGQGKLDSKDIGVAKSSISLKLEGAGAPVEILFGKDAAVEGKIYLRLANSNTVYVVGNELKNQVTKKADDFRDRRLTDLNASQINKVLIKTASGEIELQKQHEHWELNKPIKARGDDAKIGDQIAQTLNTRIDSFVSGDLTAAAAAAIAEPRGTVTFYAEGSDTPTVVQVSKGNEKDKDKVYAKLSVRDSIFVMPKSVGDILEMKPNDLRDKHLARLNLDIVDRINIEAPGKPKVTLARKQEDWTIKTSGDKPANSVEVRRMADALQNQQVTAFVADVATELPKYGLDQPQLKVNFASYASENTAESKAGENSIVTVLFGKIDGDNVYAKLDDEPFVVSVSKSILDGIFVDPLQWQDLAIFKAKPDDVTTLQVTREAQPLDLKKENGVWKPAKGDATINQTNVQSLLNTLTALHAVRWSGATKPEHGLDKPALVLSFTTADKKTSRLRIGAPTPDGMFYAAADGFDGTFVVNKPDHDAFDAPLTQGAQSTATASPGQSPAIAPTPAAAAPIAMPSPMATPVSTP